MAARKKPWPAVEKAAILRLPIHCTVASEHDLRQDFEALADSVSESDLVKERRLKDRADMARVSFWVGVTLLGIFLVPLINLAPARFTDPVWQLNFISLLMSNGAWSLLGVLLICLARLLNDSDRMIRNRALLVRNLASWIALAWLLLIPLQLFVSIRLINTLGTRELGEIQNVQRVNRLVSNATTEAEVRSALAQIPNQPPLPRLTVSLDIAKANLLGQIQRNINAAKNRQEQRASDRWQTWLKEAFRNGIQCSLLALGYLAIGKKRNLSMAP